jgi:NAD(P)-dependent dehydrogenase (short-subunit alcohol dehydrogenase family)
MSKDTVLVTGGAKRLGREIALTCARAGFRVAVHYNNSKDEAEGLAAEIGGVAVGGDLRTPDIGPKIIETAAELLAAPLTGLVNSASIFPHDCAQDATEDALLDNFRVNALAPIRLAQAFAAQGPRGSCIVNILDQKLFNLNPDHFSYTVSKQALHGATMTMALAFAPACRVVGVAPGYNLPAPDQPEEEFERLAPTVNVMQKRLEPRHVAETVLFALGNPAITGQVLIADNGEHLKASPRDVSFSD